MSMLAGGHSLFVSAKHLGDETGEHLHTADSLAPPNLFILGAGSGSAPPAWKAAG